MSHGNILSFTLEKIHEIIANISPNAALLTCTYLFLGYDQIHLQQFESVKILSVQTGWARGYMQCHSVPHFSEI